MSFDLFQQRRNFNARCMWWSRDEGDEYEEDELVYKRIPNGYFYAKEINAETKDNNVLGGVIMVDRTSVTIESADDLIDIQSQIQAKNNVLVKYQGDLWRVESVQKKKARIQNSEFGKPTHVSHYWYLNLVK